MATYAKIEDVQSRMTRTLSAEEKKAIASLLEDAAAMIDDINSGAKAEAKKIISCRMIIRTLGSGADAVPIGASQGSVSALGYSQSWTIGGGSSGELYLSKAEKKMLGSGNKIGSRSPLEDVVKRGLQ